MYLRSRLVIANWKQNGDMALLADIHHTLENKIDENTTVVVCPPSPYLGVLCGKENSFALGSQNVSAQPDGAFTGEVSAKMLAECKVKYVIVGHSERREIYAENDQVVAQKFGLVVAQRLIPILCVGETAQQRNDGSTEAVIGEQIKAVIESVGIEAFDNAIVAYEPIWAIGTGKTATAQMVQDAHQFIRQFVAKYSIPIAQKLPIIYGGSVNAANSKSIFAGADIDGGLVGGASLKPKEFLAICQSFIGNT